MLNDRTVTLTEGVAILNSIGQLNRVDCTKYCEFEGKKLKSCNLPEKLVSEIKKILSDGELIVYPTDTIYTIGADIFDEQSVKKVYMAKKRPFDMPVSVSVLDEKMAARIARPNKAALRLMKELMPGPLIILVEKNEDVPDLLTAGASTVGIRMPDHPVAREILRAYGPLTSASANKHSSSNPVTIEQCMKELGESVSMYIDCGKHMIGQQSTIVDTTDDTFPVVRKGPIPEERILEVLAAI